MFYVNEKHEPFFISHYAFHVILVKNKNVRVYVSSIIWPFTLFGSNKQGDIARIWDQDGRTVKEDCGDSFDELRGRF